MIAGLPVTENCWLQRNLLFPPLLGSPVRTAGLLVRVNYQLQRHLLFPILTGKKPASNPVLTAGSLVTEVSWLQTIVGDKLVGQEVFTEKFL